MQDAPFPVTVDLSPPLEAALRYAALWDVNSAADDLQSAVNCEDVDEILALRTKLGLSWAILDAIGYVAGDRPLECLTAPADAFFQVSTSALNMLRAQIAEPGTDGHVDSPAGLRDSAALWEQLSAIGAGAEGGDGMTTCDTRTPDAAAWAAIASAADQALASDLSRAGRREMCCLKTAALQAVGLLDERRDEVTA